MPQMVLEVTPELQKRVTLWGTRVGEVPEVLAVRALEEYVEDLEDYYEAARVSLQQAIEDSRNQTNLHGPYASAEEAVASMLED